MAKDGFKGAIAGGLLLGGIGALAGYLATKSNSIYQLGLEFGLDNFDQPSFTFMFFDSQEKFSVNNHEVVAAKERLHKFMSHILVIDKRYNKSSLFSNKIDLDGDLK